MREFWDSLGQFWLAVAGAIAAQWLLTEETMTRKQTAAAVVCGVLCAWFGTWPLVEHYTLSASNVPLVAGLLALTGRQIMAVALKRIPDLATALVNALANKVVAITSATLDSWAAGRSKDRPRKEDRSNDPE